MFQQQSSARVNKYLIKAVIVAWLIAGTLDISSAIISYSINTKDSLLGLFQFIASGAFGNAAFSGGVPMAIAGLLFHYLIALTWTIIFFFLYPRFNFLKANKFIVGTLYGIFVWLVMNLIVLRLSRVPMINYHISHIIAGTLYLIFCIGIPVSFLANKYYSIQKF